MSVYLGEAQGLIRWRGRCWRLFTAEAQIVVLLGETMYQTPLFQDASLTACSRFWVSLPLHGLFSGLTNNQPRTRKMHGCRHAQCPI